MAATRLMLGSAILGLFWTSTSLPRLALANNNNAPASSSVVDGANGNGRCNSPPCTCDQYGRLTCDCKDAGEVTLARVTFSRLYLVGFPEVVADAVLWVSTGKVTGRGGKEWTIV